MNASIPMTSIAIAPTLRAERFGQRLLLVNGIVLAGVATVQATFDLAGSFLNLGPTAGALYQNPDTIGYFEAHALALMIAILILMNRKAEGATWNWVAAAFHAMAGGSNLIFWSSFSVYGLVPMGVAATTMHAVFLALQLVAAFARTPEIFGGRGAVFRASALVTLVTGMVLHASSLALGRDAFVQQLFTPLFDAIFAIPMTIAGVSAIWLYRSAMFPALWQRLVYIFIAFYFTLSIFIHLSTLITWDTSYVLAFPAWYPLAALALMLSLTVFVIRQRFTPVDGRLK
jgi:hypothetical protein